MYLLYIDALEVWMAETGSLDKLYSRLKRPSSVPITSSETCLFILESSIFHQTQSQRPCDSNGGSKDVNSQLRASKVRGWWIQDYIILGGVDGHDDL